MWSQAAHGWTRWGRGGRVMTCIDKWPHVYIYALMCAQNRTLCWIVGHVTVHARVGVCAHACMRVHVCAPVPSSDHTSVRYALLCPCFALQTANQRGYKLDIKAHTSPV